MYKIKRQDYTNGIERDFMSAVILAIKNSKTTEDRVQKMCQQYLHIVKEPLVESIVRQLKELARTFTEVSDVAHKYWAQYLEDVKKITLSRTRVYLKNGNIEKALITVKGGTYYV